MQINVHDVEMMMGYVSLPHRTFIHHEQLQKLKFVGFLI